MERARAPSAGTPPTRPVVRAAISADDAVVAPPCPRPTRRADDALATTLARAVSERAASSDLAPSGDRVLQRWPWSKKKTAVSAPLTITHHVRAMGGHAIPVGALVPYRGTSVRIRSDPADPTFLLKVARLLESVEAVLGAGLIDAIDQSGEKVTIIHGALNYCRGGGTASSMKLRGRHSESDRAGFALQLNAAMQSAGVTTNDLAAQVAARRLPHWDNTRTPSPFGDQNAALAILQPWVDGASALAHDQQSHARVDVLSLVLADHLTPGERTTSTISIDPDLTNAGGGAGIRPPEVGLAHELTHAYYNARGTQLGIEDSSSELSGGRLFELMAVGMKPFDNRPYSENRMRSGLAGVPPRVSYP